MTRIIGIDPSLTGTGIALLDTEDHLVIPTHTVTTKPAGTTIERRLARIRVIADRVESYAVNPGAGPGLRPGHWGFADLAVIEAPAFSSRMGQQHDRSGLWWAIVNELSMTMPVVEVPPTTRAKYATGRGNAGKDEVLLAVAKRYPHVDITDNNQADALVLAAIGAHLVGHPIDELPKANLDALAKLPKLTELAA